MVPHRSPQRLGLRSALYGCARGQSLSGAPANHKQYVSVCACCSARAAACQCAGCISPTQRFARAARFLNARLMLHLQALSAGSQHHTRMCPLITCGGTVRQHGELNVVLRPAARAGGAGGASHAGGSAPPGAACGQRAAVMRRGRRQEGVRCGHCSQGCGLSYCGRASVLQTLSPFLVIALGSLLGATGSLQSARGLVRGCACRSCSHSRRLAVQLQYGVRQAWRPRWGRIGAALQRWLRPWA